MEADEATFDKRNIANVLEFKHLVKSKRAPSCGNSGAASSKGDVQHRWYFAGSPPKSQCYEPLAPGPGAIRRVEWKALANEFCLTAKWFCIRTLLKAINSKCPEHCKKRVKVLGKWRWQQPHYIRLVKHKLPGSKGKTLTVKSGTQTIDRVGRFLKDKSVFASTSIPKLAVPCCEPN